MKLNYLLFWLGLVLLTIGLWDYFSLRALSDISRDEERQQLVPSIVGSVFLVISPLFEHQISKWIILLVCLFLVLTSIILLRSIFMASYADFSFIMRHILGFVLIMLSFLIMLRSTTRKSTFA